MNNAIQKYEAGGEVVSIGGVTWTREVLDLCKKTICPKGISDAEFELFVTQCRTRGLNPFAGEAFCVQRRTNVGTKDSPQWVTTNVLQTAIAGMRARAERHGDLEIFKGAAIFEKDTCILDFKKGEADHKYDAAKARGAFMGAWAQVKRRGQDSILIHLLPGSRRADGPVYANNPSEHLAKCAKAAALREAYPSAFAGIYAREEMPDESEPQSRAGQVLQRLENGLPDAERKAVQELLDKTPALPPPGPVVVFGQWRDRPVDGLDRTELEAAISYGTEQLNDPKHAKAKFRPALEKNLSLLCERLAGMPADPVPESPPEMTEEEKRAAVEAEIASQRQPGEDG